jgi:hypothetical protein
VEFRLARPPGRGGHEAAMVEARLVSTIAFRGLVGGGDSAIVVTRPRLTGYRVGSPLAVLTRHRPRIQNDAEPTRIGVLFVARDEEILRPCGLETDQ